MLLKRGTEPHSPSKPGKSAGVDASGRPLGCGDRSKVGVSVSPITWLQGGNVGLPALIDAGGGLSRRQLGPHVAAEVTSGADELPAGEILPHQASQCLGGLVLGRAQQLRHPVLVVAPASSRDTVTGSAAVSTPGPGARVQDPFGEDGNGGGHLGLLVEDLEDSHQRP